MKHICEDYNRIQDPLELIGKDEPVFLLRAKDRTMSMTIRAWANYQQIAGGSNKDVVDTAFNWANEVELWQAKNGCKQANFPKNLDLDDELKLLLQTTYKYSKLPIREIILPQFITTNRFGYEVIFENKKAVYLVSVSVEWLDSYPHKNDIFFHLSKVVNNVDSFSQRLGILAGKFRKPYDIDADFSQKKLLFETSLDHKLRVLLLKHDNIHGRIKTLNEVVFPQFITTGKMAFQLMFDSERRISYLLQISPQEKSIQNNSNCFYYINSEIENCEFEKELLNIWKNQESNINKLTEQIGDFQNKTIYVDDLKIQAEIEKREKFECFESELEQLINKYSLENGSNTPDFILASFLAKQLLLFNEIIGKRKIYKTGL